MSLHIVFRRAITCRRNKIGRGDSRSVYRIPRNLTRTEITWSLYVIPDFTPALSGHSTVAAVVDTFSGSFVK